jgi:hypothetical protein
MDPRTNTSVMVARTLLLLFALAMIAILIMKPTNTASVVHAQGERVLENTIPKHVPIKLKIKKEIERSFKDLNDEKWISELELELTNTGDKPIYYLDLLLVSDVQLDGSYLVFPLAYGRDALGDIISKAQPHDTPIKPGETFIFKIHPGQILAWEKSVRQGKHSEAKRLQIKLESLSFGDGTGYFGNSGTVYPSSSRLESVPKASAEQPKKKEFQSSRPRIRSGTRIRTFQTTNMPVSLLPAYFLSKSDASVVTAPASPNNSCLFEECVGVIPAPRVHVCYNCP